MKIIKCVICDSLKFHLLFRGWDRALRADKQKFDVVRCDNCGLAYINPQPTEAELKKTTLESGPAESMETSAANRGDVQKTDNKITEMPI